MSRRIDIRIPEDTLARIDAEAYERRMTRTAVLIERWNESVSRAVEAEAAPLAPARAAEELPPPAEQGEHGARGEPGDRELRTRMKHSPCTHAKAKVLRLKTCPDCGERI